MPSADGVHVLAAVVGSAKGDVQVDLVAGLAGFVALALLWMAVVWGIIQRVGWSFTRVKYASLQAVHRSLAILGLTLGLVHSGSQIARVNGDIKWYDQFIPFINESDPIGTGIGVVGLELAVAVTISVAFQRALGFNRWRALHLLSYVSFTLVSAHALISGAAGSVQVFDMRFINPVIIAGWGLTVLLGLVTAIRPAPPVDTGAATPEEVDPDAAIPVQVDPIKCSRFGFCEHEAPDLFKLRADGMLTHQPKVGPERLDAAIEAARICPARAITLGRSPKVGPASPPGLRTTGSIKAQPAGFRTGSQPAVRTGSQPAMRTGSQPAMRTGSQPAVRPGQLALPAGSSRPMQTNGQPAMATGGQPPLGANGQPLTTGGQPPLSTGSQPPLSTNGQPVLRTDGRPALRVVPTSPGMGPVHSPQAVPLRQPEPVQPPRPGPPPAGYPATPVPAPPPATPPPAMPPYGRQPDVYEPVTALPSSSQGFPAIVDYAPAMPHREEPPPMPRREDPPAMPRREQPPRGTTYDTGSRNYTGSQDYTGSRDSTGSREYGGKHHREDD